MRITTTSVVLFTLAGSLLAPLTPAQQSEAETAAAADPDAAPEPVEIPYLRPSGAYSDLPEMGFDPMSLLGGGGAKPKSFFRLLEMIGEWGDAGGDELVLDLSGGFGLNLPQQREVERAIAAVRSKGKHITCYVENAGIGSYQVAAQCDRVLMADMGSVDLRSLSMNVMHFKDALDLLGVQVDVTRVGEFKGAVEPYMLSQMSPHLREHYRAMLGSMNEDVVRRIATGRGLSRDKVRELQAVRLFSAKQALLEGLVDRLVPWEGCRRAFAKIRGDDNFELKDIAPKKKKKRRDFMSLFASLMRSDEEEEIEDPQVVVMHLAGQIVDGSSKAPGSMVSGPAVARLDRLADNDLVKGVVVRINSPGGSATASEAIRLALQRLAKKKPVVFSMGELAASGGYWITAIGEPILAETGTITGSIGVFGMRMVPGALMRRIGVHSEIVSLDEGAQMDAMDRPWAPAARERMQSYVDDIYDRFLAIVAKSRGKTPEKIDAIAGGRVWSGQQALENGLIDRIGGVDDAIAMVRERAEIGGDVEVLHVPEPTNFADSLFSSIFEAQLQAAKGKVGFEALVAEFCRFPETAGLLIDAVRNRGKNQIYALMPTGLRVR